MGLLRATESKRNFSKYDPSGTDPNRYASVSNTAEADEYLHKGKKSIVPGFRVNVGKTERIIMIAAGSYLLYRALAKKDKQKTAEAISAGTMLFRGVTGYCPAYDAIDRAGIMDSSNINIATSLTINKQVSEVYSAWRNLENLPFFMTHIKSITPINEFISEWKAELPHVPGAEVSWKAEILMDEPGELLSWHSMPGSTIHNAGKIHFTAVGDATDIDVLISYRAPLGKPGELAAKLLNPVFERMIENDIKNFKEYIESGAIIDWNVE